MELLFLCPNKESDSKIVRFAVRNIAQSSAQPKNDIKTRKNDTRGTSKPCQMDVNRGIFLCDRIEIRIREVIFDENGTIIRKMLIFGRM